MLNNLPAATLPTEFRRRMAFSRRASDKAMGHQRFLDGEPFPGQLSSVVPRNEHNRIDEAILSVAQPSWRKVAMIIIRSAEVIGTDNKAGFNLIASRIEALVEEGRLDAQGDLKKWRHSEVRLAGSAL